jgi:serine/threonine protein kinase
MAGREEEDREGGRGEREGTRIGDYLVGRTIGEGTFNKVKIARHVHSQEQVAIKLIDKSKILSAGDRQRLTK